MREREREREGYTKSKQNFYVENIFHFAFIQN
jgi:hypothetical protein